MCLTCHYLTASVLKEEENQARRQASLQHCLVGVLMHVLMVCVATDQLQRVTREKGLLCCHLSPEPAVETGIAKKAAGYICCASLTCVCVCARTEA